MKKFVNVLFSLMAIFILSSFSFRGGLREYRAIKRDIRTTKEIFGSGSDWSPSESSASMDTIYLEISKSLVTNQVDSLILYDSSVDFYEIRKKESDKLIIYSFYRKGATKDSETFSNDINQEIIPKLNYLNVTAHIVFHEYKKPIEWGTVLFLSLFIIAGIYSVYVIIKRWKARDLENLKNSQ